MSNSLVSISHPIEPSAFIPFINCAAPLVQVVIDTRFIDPLERTGFIVEVHKSPYDPVQVANEKAEALATALAASTGVTAPVTAPAPSVAKAKAPKAPAPVPEVVVEAPAAPAVEAEVVVEAPAVEAEVPVEDDGVISEEELAELRERVSSAESIKVVRAIAAEYEIELPVGLTGLDNLKATILGMLSGE